LLVDSDYYLPVLIKNYFVDTSTGRSRVPFFFSNDPSINPANAAFTYADLALLNAEKIVNTSAAFATPGGQTLSNLIHLKPNQIVGEWRDSTYGIGGGRIPYDVNTALVPAALRAIAALSVAGFFPSHPDWRETAASYAQIWEDSTLRFFEVNIPAAEARDLVTQYVETASGDGVPASAEEIADLDDDVMFYGLARDGNDNQSTVRVMNSDDCFRLFFLNTTDQVQLSAFLNQAAEHILRPFPVGLTTDVGLLVANPAYGGDEVYARNWTRAAYHGTVVWGWPMAMMAEGLRRQLRRCDGGAGDNPAVTTTTANAAGIRPGFCDDEVLYGKVRRAYNHLWDILDDNRRLLSQEVWSWEYNSGGNGRFDAVPLGSLAPPEGGSPTESDVVQLWSLAFLGVVRDVGLRG